MNIFFSATVHITVSDVNEYAPTFSEPSYVRQVDEGRIYREIVRVEATDRDCTPKFGDVCKYEILTSDQPFVIDMDGVIRNTEPLDYERSHNHILSVVAYDCGKLQLKSLNLYLRLIYIVLRYATKFTCYGYDKSKSCLSFGLERIARKS